MKSPVGLLSILAALLAAPAMAGEIVKCVDASGHVTLTDQPCDAGNATVRLNQEAEGAAAPERVVHAVAPQRTLWQRPSATAASAQPVRLARDVETLKAAHRMMLLQDAKPRLAGLN